MDITIIIAINGLFFGLFAWFLNVKFNNINKQFNELKSDYKGLRDELKSDYKGLRDELKSDYNELKSDYKDLKNELKANNREIRNQVYNHIPTKLQKIEDESKERDEKMSRDLEEIKVLLKDRS